MDPPPQMRLPGPKDIRIMGFPGQGITRNGESLKRSAAAAGLGDLHGATPPGSAAASDLPQGATIGAPCRTDNDMGLGNAEYQAQALPQGAKIGAPRIIQDSLPQGATIGAPGLPQGATIGAPKDDDSEEQDDSLPIGSTIGGLPQGSTIGGLPQGSTIGGLPQGSTIGAPRDGLQTPSDSLPLGSTIGGLPQGSTIGAPKIDDSQNQGSSLPLGSTIGSLPQGSTIGGLPPGATIGSLPQGSTIGSLPQGSMIGGLPQGATIGGFPQGATISAPELDANGTVPSGGGATSSNDHLLQPSLDLAGMQQALAAQLAQAQSLVQSVVQMPVVQPEVQLVPVVAADIQAQQADQMLQQQQQLALFQAQQQLLGGANGLSTGSSAQGVDESSMAVLQEVSAAQQAQYLQQCQFQAQVRQYDNMKAAQVTDGSTLLPTGRLMKGYRPMQLCKKLLNLGTCYRGDECTFAHAIEELHPASPDLPKEQQGPENVLALAMAEQTVDDFSAQIPTMRMKKKREMCQRKDRGGCLLGTKCMFAHTEDELGTVALVITDRVRTSICKVWEQGKCIYGKYCVNAHGMQMIGTLKPPEDLCPPNRSNRRD